MAKVWGSEEGREVWVSVLGCGEVRGGLQTCGEMCWGMGRWSRRCGREVWRSVGGDLHRVGRVGDGRIGVGGLGSGGLG